MSLEVCVESIGSAFTAKQYGADRLEVCSSLSCGGLTPSIGFVEQISKLWIPFRIMLRPRAGNFCYSEPELQTIISDVQNFINLKDTAFLEGFVIGFLDEQGHINMAAAQRIMERVPSNFSFTWHRAIDCCTEPLIQAAKTISANPRVDFILTSGAAPQALDGTDNIGKLMTAVKGSSTTIMPGSGIDDGTISALKARLGEQGHTLQWVHASCSRRITSGHRLINDDYRATDATSLCDLKGRL